MTKRGNSKENKKVIAPRLIDGRGRDEQRRKEKKGEQKGISTGQGLMDGRAGGELTKEDKKSEGK